MAGPLTGVRIIEMVGIGPGPYAGMLLADLGAEVIAVERIGGSSSLPKDLFRRGKRFIGVDTKTDSGKAVVRTLAKTADALFEGFRPGVMERLGLGPDDLMALNPKLVYGRMTGWGQTGPLADRAGHDITYIAVAGALGAMGPAGAPPVPPLNLVGDFGGGSLFLIMGLLSALLHAQKTGEGQVVDAAMVDGVASLTGLFHALSGAGLWGAPRGQNWLDGGSAHYGTYETRDGKYMAIGPLEPQFAAEFYRLMDMPDDAMAKHMSPTDWPETRAQLAERFAAKTQAEWTEIFDGTDACVAPVMDLTDAPNHPHMKARASHFEASGLTQPAPAPRFSVTEPSVDGTLPTPGSATDAVLTDIGFDAETIAKLRADKVIG